MQNFDNRFHNVYGKTFVRWKILEKYVDFLRIVCQEKYSSLKKGTSGQKTWWLALGRTYYATNTDDGHNFATPPYLV